MSSQTDRLYARAYQCSALSKAFCDVRNSIRNCVLKQALPLKKKKKSFSLAYMAFHESFNWSFKYGLCVLKRFLVFLLVSQRGMQLSISVMIVSHKEE